MYVVGNGEYIARVSASLRFMASNAPTFAKAYNAIAGSSTTHVWITEEAASSCANVQRTCTRPAGVNGARISHTLTSTDYFNNYTFVLLAKVTKTSWATNLPTLPRCCCPRATRGFLATAHRGVDLSVSPARATSKIA